MHLEKTLMLGKIEAKKGRGKQRMRWLDGMPDSVDKNLSKLRDVVEGRLAWCPAVHEVTKSWTWLSNGNRSLWILFIYVCMCMLSALKILKCRFSDSHNPYMYQVLTVRKKHILFNVLGESGKQILQKWIGRQPTGTQVACNGYCASVQYWRT